MDDGWGVLCSNSHRRFHPSSPGTPYPAQESVLKFSPCKHGSVNTPFSCKHRVYTCVYTGPGDHAESPGGSEHGGGIN